MLSHLAEPVTAPLIAPARDPPGVERELDQTPEYAITAPESIPDYDFDPTVSG